MNLTFYTSGFFALSAIHAAWRGYWDIMLVAGLTLCTSLTYHYLYTDDSKGFVMKIIRFLDILIGNASVLYGTYTLAVLHWCYILSLVVMVYMALIYWINGTNIRVHAIFHGLGNIAIMLAVEANYLAGGLSLRHYR
jgi:hypothetical protein